MDNLTEEEKIRIEKEAAIKMRNSKMAGSGLYILLLIFGIFGITHLYCTNVWIKVLVYVPAAAYGVAYAAFNILGKGIPLSNRIGNVYAALMYLMIMVFNIFF